MLSNQNHQATQGSVIFTYTATFLYNVRIMGRNPVGDAGTYIFLNVTLRTFTINCMCIGRTSNWLVI